MEPKPSIQYIRPTSQSLGRMTTILFRPFDMGKWFVLGLSAWLATMLDGNGVNFSFNSFGDDSSNDGTPETPGEWLETVKVYFQENIDWILPVGIGAIVLGITIYVILGWLSARGKFMLLDNLVYNRALVKAPWREFKSQGNSLFLWKLVFYIIYSIVFLGIFGGVGYYVYTLMPAGFALEPDQSITTQFPSTLFGILIAAGLGLFLLSIVTGYFIMLLEDFVIPMMYKKSLSATEGWRAFFEIHRSHTGKFILYAFWKFLMTLCVAITVFVLAIITCCVAGLLMAIPYLGAVLLLPVTLFMRALGPEFLRQFGPPYDLWEGASDHFNFD